MVATGLWGNDLYWCGWKQLVARQEADRVTSLQRCLACQCTAHCHSHTAAFAQLPSLYCQCSQPVLATLLLLSHCLPHMAAILPRSSSYCYSSHTALIPLLLLHSSSHTVTLTISHCIMVVLPTLTKHAGRGKRSSRQQQNDADSCAGDSQDARQEFVVQE
jgi:hypothetical protein